MLNAAASRSAEDRPGVPGGLSRQSIYNLARADELRLVKIRRRTFIRVSDLDAIIERGSS
ncbi:MAG: helix-turn-helix domain-containing protein [Acidimicrobiia bacterium]|nr:helix-turn-helix domain-containing protein [Acidimicrobiia bacterium]